MSAPDAPTKFRLFVAVTVPEQIKARILEAQSRLRHGHPQEAIRWTRPEQFHLTLRFLGHLETSQVEPLIESLRAACHGFGVLHLRAAGAGFFPRPSSPRVLWAGVADSGERLPALWEAVQSATNLFTTEEPDNSFTGHITLARIKFIRPTEAETLAADVNELATTVFGEWTASEVELIRSQLSPQGARYSTVAAVPL
jgi:RNA 2',3'-cyclic 3'-phosphodiesterase